MKHLRTLAYVTEIARAGSIRRAAERLSITPSALTRQIQDLEYELGTPIFERLAQGMRLNAAASCSPGTSATRWRTSTGSARRSPTSPACAGAMWLWPAAKPS